MQEHINPIQWTIATWFAVIFCLLAAVALNLPPHRVSMANADTGELMQPVLIDSYKSMPIPFGWPFRYIVPHSFARNLSPLSQNGNLILTGPTTISRTKVTLNITLVCMNAACLALLLQSYARRFSMMTFLALPVIFAILMIVGQMIGNRSIGLAWVFFTIVYFLPSLAVLTYHSFHFFIVKKQVAVKEPVGSG